MGYTDQFHNSLPMENSFGFKHIQQTNIINDYYLAPLSCLRSLDSNWNKDIPLRIAMPNIYYQFQIPFKPEMNWVLYLGEYRLLLFCWGRFY